MLGPHVIISSRAIIQSIERITCNCQIKIKAESDVRFGFSR